MFAADYLENKIVDHVVGKTSFTMPTCYLALCSALPTDASTGSTITEVVYTTYARKVTAGADWNASSGGANSNATELQFAACTAGSATARAFAGVDALTVGNLLFWSPLGTAAWQTVTPANFTRVTTTATIVLTAHGYTTGDEIAVVGANDANYNGIFTITVTDANTFTFTVTNAGASPATTADRIRVKKVTSLAISVGITPRFQAGVLVVSAD